MRSILLVLVPAASVAALWMAAGPLNPPTGPLNAGGKTTQEIFDAVTANSQATGAIGGRGPAVPGTSVAQGSFTLTPGSGAPISGPILGFRVSASMPWMYQGASLIGGVSSVSNFTVVRDMAQVGVPVWRGVTAGSTFSSATITVPSAGGSTVYTLTTVGVAGVRYSHIQRADGTFVSIEEIDLFPVSARMTDPAGAGWTWNFANRTGSN